MPRPPSRWEQLLDQKPVLVGDHVLEEISRLFAEELQRWPPEVQQDAASGLQDLLRADSPPFSPLHFEEAFQLARWELRRELDAADDYMRNRRYLAAGLEERDRRLLQFLSRWMIEQLLALGEATEGRIDRPRMVVCLDRTAEQVRRRAT